MMLLINKSTDGHHKTGRTFHQICWVSQINEQADSKRASNKVKVEADKDKNAFQ